MTPPPRPEDWVTHPHKWVPKVGIPPRHGPEMGTTPREVTRVEVPMRYGYSVRVSTGSDLSPHPTRH